MIDGRAVRYFPDRGDEGYSVRHYDLALDYRPEPNRLAGVATLSAVANEPLDQVRLDLGTPMRVAQVLVGGRRTKFTHRAGKLRVNPGRWLPEGGAFTVEVRYSGNPRPVPSPWGPLGWEQLEDGALVASQPTGASSWFPCNDRPSDKATYQIAITTAAPYTVVCNGRLASMRRAGSRTTWVYRESAPMASYLATVQIGRYQVGELPGQVPQRLAAPAAGMARARQALARQDRMMRVFGEWFGPYPFDEYAVVVTEDDLEIPVEAQSMSIFGPNQLAEERLVAHELAHQWFGNSLTLAYWRDIWLHEGFACYAEWLWSEASGGEPAAAHARRWHARLAARPADFVLADPGPKRLFDDRVYKRGALTLHALRERLGEPAFRAVLHEWADGYRHGTVTTGRFTELAARYAAGSLDAFFMAWLYSERLPPLS
ncbi:M1 family metallopeptidase [Nonomuraea typhae]|uniref:M1 family metallopeptidase n=1 Tax=Nonomuraea typhae TaxID=2603600 RepID=UPI0012FADB63|nr:M1 family metallopeptidase [Nonomuraea typhae]